MYPKPPDPDAKICIDICMFRANLRIAKMSPLKPYTVSKNAEKVFPGFEMITRKAAWRPEKRAKTRGFYKVSKKVNKNDRKRM